MRGFALAFAVAAMLLAGRAIAYDIRPVAGVHEAFTLLAERCRTEAGAAQPRDCLRYADEVGRWTGRRDNSTDDPLQLAVRWPDDPLRQLSSTAGTLRYGRSMTSSCPRSVRETAAIDRMSLTCASHFGPLQFFHAMASANGEAAEQTRARILDWADLTYRLAIGRVPLSTNICSWFRDNPSDISPSFSFDDPEICAPGDEREWTLATFFGQACDSATNTANCDRLGEERAMAAVRGALLHVIQDSYSQSHAARGRALAGGGYRPRVVCRLPSGFYNYLGQAGHGDADSQPEFDQTCGAGAEADDVITASAMALHFLDRRADPGEFSCYLQARVFGRRTVWANPNPRARYSCRA
jgi:hypothetical protein